MTFVDHHRRTLFPLKLTVVSNGDNDNDAVVITGKFLKRIVADLDETVTYRNSLGESKPLISAIFTTYYPMPEPFFTLAEIIEEIDVDDDSNYIIGFVSVTDRRLCLKRTSYRDIVQMNSLMAAIGHLYTIAKHSTRAEEVYKCINRTLLEDLRYLSADLIEINQPEVNGDKRYKFGPITVRTIDYISCLTFDDNDEIVEAWVYHPEGIASIHVEPSGDLDDAGRMLPMVSITREKDLTTMMKILRAMLCQGGI